MSNDTDPDDLDDLEEREILEDLAGATREAGRLDQTAGSLVRAIGCLTRAVPLTGRRLEMTALALSIDDEPEVEAALDGPPGDGG